ncbi:MAG: phosphatidylserine decarboxylase family protein [Bacteroidetes bacterium]|uniref:Phosphatidylserine decarboxylase proenzyme n=1 Tax=Phaeocystidibacter marisrubri TaxID=1577780 RepID=A0A6L3ZGR6_9FLAO|nr:phosphatidylserine decarboxylase family protein [Phaeocystidibacter marisrubri]KAB2817027.1 phosphatidylserine decarboxylase family protein [Phaeocystidibacter marisrubri]TNE31472.1 MAG: phosphatidylserine decarboxylase family protein [Bacteroidota bacterium]GGH77151.1 phosphatidylserine decarboxylase [Phaeocystidibacter marisrubri]
MKLHPEGRKPLFVALLIFAALNFLFSFIGIDWLEGLLLIASGILYGFMVYFFRHPARFTNVEPHQLIAPADGKVVAIQEVEETEYFNDKRIQVSIFMSPLNVHVNRFPIGGIVKYSKHHPGAFLVAWHPKSSTLNERTTVVVQADNGVEVMHRQIAGAVARRIINYAKPNTKVATGDQCGFIRFGSRVDILLPLDAKIKVEIGQRPIGGETILAEI